MAAVKKLLSEKDASFKEEVEKQSQLKLFVLDDNG